MKAPPIEPAKGPDPEHASQLTEARWRAVLDVARDAIISIDRSGRITLFNRSAEEIFGYPAEEVLGRNVSILMPTPYREEHDGYIHSYQKTGVAKAIGRIRDVEGRRKNGEVFPIELSVSEASFGAEVLYVAILRDVSERRSMEETVRKQRDFAERLIETAQGIVLLLDPAGRIVRFNEYMERLSGHRLEEVEGRDWFETFLPEPIREDFRKSFHRVLERVDARGFVNTILTKSGAEHEIEWHARTLRDARGDIEGVLSIGVDITERLRSARRFTAQHTVTRALASSASLAEATPRILESLCEGFGFEMGELWSVDSAAEVLRREGVWHGPGIRGIEPDPDDPIALRMNEGIPGAAWAKNQNEFVSDVTQHPGFVRRKMAISLGLRAALAFPIRSGGNVIGIVSLFSRRSSEPDIDLFRMLDSLASQIGDFIDRKRADEAVRYSEARFYAFMNNGPAIAYMKDEAGRYVYVNEPFVHRFGASAKSIHGKTDFDLWPRETAEMLRANDRAVLAGNDTAELLETVPLPDGEAHAWLSFKFPISDPEGRRLLAAMSVDITDRLRAEQELRDIQRTTAQRERLADIGAITAKIAHDLGNPLGALSMQTQVMLRRAERDPEAAFGTAIDAMKQLASEVRRLESLVRQLVSFSRDQRLDLKWIDPDRLVKDVVDLWEPLASERGIRLSSELCGSVPSFQCDPEQLRRVLDNLTKNAIEAIDSRGGRVIVRVSAPSSEKVRISVEDTGPGIPEEIQVFRLFQTTKPAGSGLGLAVSKQIVDAHGGALSYEAATPRGTTFHVELPRLREKSRWE